MDSETSTNSLTPAGAKTVIIPRIPQYIIDEILDHLAADSPALASLRSCALVSKSWAPSCRRHLFRVITFNSRNMDTWFEAFPVPGEVPAHHARTLRVFTTGISRLPEKFFEYPPWFTNVEKAVVLGHGGVPVLRIPSPWKLPRSVTTLSINTDIVTLADIQTLLAQLPNLENLLLHGAVTLMDTRALVEAGTVPRGKFGGELVLRGGYVETPVVDMLFETPTWLHFTEVSMHGGRECLRSTVRLAEACSRTLLKLTYTVGFHDDSEDFKRSIDFSKFPNLQEVKFDLEWIRGGLFWIPIALSTIKPATSPRLSNIELNCRPTPNRSTRLLANDAGDHLRWVADEVARIELEFEGAVKFSILQHRDFLAVLDRLNILQHFRR